MYERVKKLSRKEFRRKVGVKADTFKKMIKILKEKEKEQKSKGGRPTNLIMEDRALMALEYLREYRTYFHIETSYGI